MSRHSHFIIGISLGVGIQPTALAVVEQVIDSGGNWLAKTRALELRHLERLPAQTSYPDTVERVATLLSSPEIDEGEGCGEAGVVVDVTGSGRAILELFKRSNIRVVTVGIVGAGVREEEVEFGDWRLPKVELVGTLRVAYETERLRMAKSLELVPAMVGASASCPASFANSSTLPRASRMAAMVAGQFLSPSASPRMRSAWSRSSSTWSNSASAWVASWARWARTRLAGKWSS